MASPWWLNLISKARILMARPYGWRVVPRGAAPTPFQLRGPALDGEVLELELPAGPVSRGRVVEVRYR